MDVGSPTSGVVASLDNGADDRAWRRMVPTPSRGFPFAAELIHLAAAAAASLADSKTSVSILD